MQYQSESVALVTNTSTYCKEIQFYFSSLLTDRGSTAEDAAQNVINVQIPALHQLCEAGELSIDNIDVFCEKGVFDTDASRRILKAGQNVGWKLNFHGDQLHVMNSGEVRNGSCHISVLLQCLTVHRKSSQDVTLWFISSLRSLVHISSCSLLES